MGDLDLLQNALTAAGGSRGDPNQDVENNPESFVYFAMAAYIYLNPPPGVSGALFIGQMGATPRNWIPF